MVMCMAGPLTGRPPDCRLLQKMREKRKMLPAEVMLNGMFMNLKLLTKLLEQYLQTGWLCDY